ncbi:MAG: hypothetical protein JKY34_02620 [Kordiimonadaceae bacterium]|nr:hypothetical protein [Kordiimonadaceae bacterium]
MSKSSAVVHSPERSAIITERMMYLLRQNGGEMCFGDLADEMIARGWACTCFKDTTKLSETDIIRIKSPLKRMQ